MLIKIDEWETNQGDARPFNSGNKKVAAPMFGCKSTNKQTNLSMFDKTSNQSCFHNLTKFFAESTLNFEHPKITNK